MYIADDLTVNLAVTNSKAALLTYKTSLILIQLDANLVERGSLYDAIHCYWLEGGGKMAGYVRMLHSSQA